MVRGQASGQGGGGATGASGEGAGRGARPRAAEGLSARDRAVLDVELTPWPSAGAKEAEVLAVLGLSPGRYHQVLNALLDDRGALEAEPVLVHRLRRVREAARAARTGPRPHPPS